MKRMGIEALYRKPNTSKPAPGHKIYPYLLRGMTIDGPNQVWAMDITSIPMARGFVYLAAMVDWFSRRVLAWRLSITMEAAFCIEALEEALTRHARPEIFNSDQGSQFTSIGFTDVLTKAGIAISMDGRGSWRDNVFVERLWRTIKYEEVYLRVYDSVGAAREVARPLSGLLQWKEASFFPGPTDPGPGLLHPVAAFRGGLNPGRTPPIPARRLFKQTGPPLYFIACLALVLPSITGRPSGELPSDWTTIRGP